MSQSATNEQTSLDFASGDEQGGFRLARLEILNWGTFHEHIWPLVLQGANTLVTGDIGSGKSTLVDALTTLLVPPQKLAYNKAAGAEARERTLRSYVLGYYKTERGESGFSARPVALRDMNSYSVILGHFYNEGYHQSVTLAQVFWTKDPEGQPARMFVVSDALLCVATHFSNFGTEISDLRKRLKKTPHIEVHDGFASYSAAFRRRFGIENDQALELFHQTVSMKSVGNLTDFVRQHMLEALAEEGRVQALIAHYDDLNRAHQAVLKAKAQIERLAPIVHDCESHAQSTTQENEQRASREALNAYFSSLKVELLKKRLSNLAGEIERLNGRIEAGSEKRREQQGQRDELKRAIAANGGDRLERIKTEMAQKLEEKKARRQRAEQYHQLAREVGLAAPDNVETFVANRQGLDRAKSAAEDQETRIQNERTEIEVAFRSLKEGHQELSNEIISLQQRRSNIPRRMLELRAEICHLLSIKEEVLPFAGELIQVREHEHAWEGAIERLLHNFGLSLLVADSLYGQVAELVDHTHLRERLVYFRVRSSHAVVEQSRSPSSLVHKLSIRPDSEFYEWLEVELTRRFPHVCSDTLDQFRREKLAITRAGQIKGAGERHEKDDRHRLDDRSRYVLGWSNEAKLAALQRDLSALEQRMQAAGKHLSKLQNEQKALSDHLGCLKKLEVFESYRDLDWRPLVVELEELDKERREIEETADILRTLQNRLVELEKAISATEAGLENDCGEHRVALHKHEVATQEQKRCEMLLASVPSEIKERDFPRLEILRAQVLADRALSVESCENRERELREWLQREIDALSKKLERLQEKIVGAMQSFRNDYPAETTDLDASINASQEFMVLLRRLTDDDLPRFEGHFKELLNENTIREVANFQSQLFRERQTIKERVERINKSLKTIDYNPGRYIQLEMHATVDAEVRDFQTDLRACTEGALTGSEEAEYSEAKFLQVKRVIERFRGREGTAEQDRRWTRLVTDVRNWFTFSASERWREDDREQEHYTDSGGKSGGQKEKLAYTVLAASLAYQFGLEQGVKRSRSFRFVVIDEAFGRGSDESARYALELFGRMNLQLLIVTPLQKIQVIEPFVANVGFVHNDQGKLSKLRCLTIEELQAERTGRANRSGTLAS